MFPGAKQLETDIISNDLLAAQIKALESNATGNITNPFGFYLDVTGQPFSNFDFIKQGPEITRGGKTSRYSQRFIDDCRDEFGLLPKNTEPLFKPENIAIVTNGICGSTCALFSNVLKNEFKVKTFATGGVDDNKPMAFNSFNGGEVRHLGSIIKELQLVGVNELFAGDDVKSNILDELAQVGVNDIKPLPLQSDLSFTYRESYANQFPEIPLEFVFEPADFRIPTTAESDMNPVAVWQKVISLMSGSK